MILLVKLSQADERRQKRYFLRIQGDFKISPAACYNEK
jgi:hypothetical protein